MAMYQCTNCNAVETIEAFTPEACSSCGGKLSSRSSQNEPREVVYNDTQSWLGAIWHVLHMAREDCISEDKNGPNDRAWEEVCTAMAWVAEDLGVKT